MDADSSGLLSDTTMENLKGLPVEKLIVSPAGGISTLQADMTGHQLYRSDGTSHSM